MALELLDDNRENFLRVVVASAGRGDLEAVQELVDYNPAWIHQTGSHGRTMLWEAAYRGKMDVVEFLAERSADINAVGCHFSTHIVEISPYCAAKSKGREEIADYLLASGAAVDIHSAAYLGDYDLVLSFLEEDPALVNQEHPYTQRDPDPYFRATPIFYAVSGDHREIVKLLISRGADIESCDERLLKFAIWKSRDSVKILLENGIDPGKFKMGEPPEDRKLTELLNSYGAKFDVNDYHSNWPPIVRVSRGDKGEHPEKIQRLLDLGADVNIRNYKGKTALHCAAKAGFVRVMDVLVKNGADVNAADDNGETPLFDAIRSTIKKVSKKKAAVEFLLSHGADPSFENLWDVTPIEVTRKARRIEAAEIVEMLQEAEE